MTRNDEIQWCPVMLAQVRPDAFPAIRPAAPTPSDPEMRPVNIDRLIARTHATKALNAGETK